MVSACKTKYGKHLQFNNHTFLDKNVKILHQGHKQSLLFILLEELEINKALKSGTKDCCNTRSGTRDFEPIYKIFI